jgi:hypothetical protein
MSSADIGDVKRNLKAYGIMTTKNNRLPCARITLLTLTSIALLNSLSSTSSSLTLAWGNRKAGHASAVVM